MSTHGRSILPLTGVAWTSNPQTCPKDYKVISNTHDGSSANFGKGFGIKSGYYLCYTMTTQTPTVVGDIQLISEKEAIPHGYTYVSEFLENKASVSKKKRLCVKPVPASCADVIVVDIKVTVKSKMIIPHYTCVGDFNGYVIWCKKERVAIAKPLPKPRNIHVNMKDLAIDGNSSSMQEQSSNDFAPTAPPLTNRRSGLELKDPIYNTSGIYGISAMDGVPFALHPKFERHSNNSVAVSNLNMQIKSLVDIENEYDYSFVVEKTAAGGSVVRSMVESS
ncbi:multivesicular body subunit 12A [Erpetoichthys calabaricus]|uniref:Multivesicular body subunit 12A n=1 Tax=Erpetoichthys calabaricus TaxID=27687 RepID=A0A8C4TFF0_ERPCA|nr:multivesicular body subunit 12A [Erpetoichthys calabaricus]